MSQQGSITKTLVTLAPSAGDTIGMNPAALAQQMGMDRQKVNQVIFALSKRGVIEAVRGSNGRSIVSLIMRDPTEAKRLGAVRRGGRPAKRIVDVTAVPGIRTPHLDGYEHQKQRFERLIGSLGDRVQATFNEDAIAEEAVRLKARLAIVEPELTAMRKQLTECTRDLRYLRERFKADIAASAQEGQT